MNTNDRRNIRKHGAAACLRAASLNDQGWGPSSIVLHFDLGTIRTTRQCDAAINAGRALMLDRLDAQRERRSATA